MEAAKWLREHDVAAVCSDNWGVEASPGGYEGEAITVHLVLIRDVGMTLGEVFDIKGLASDCAEDDIFEFFFSAPPFRFTGAVGSPVNPLALK